MHPLMTHRDAVGNRDRPELEWVAAGGEHPFLGRLGESVQREVARRDFVPRRRDADLWLAEVFVVHAYRAQHATGGGLLQAVGDVTATRFEVSDWRRMGGCGHRSSMPVRLAANARAYPFGVWGRLSAPRPEGLTGR